MRELLPALTKQWPAELIRAYKGKPFQIGKPQPDPKRQNEIVHEYFWHKLPDFIPENSIVVAETGTSEFGKIIIHLHDCPRELIRLGVFNMHAPKGVAFLSQILWGSIGYSVGAALGAALAGKKENRRVFLLVGDGSFQVRHSPAIKKNLQEVQLLYLACLSGNFIHATISNESGRSASE